MPDSFAHRLKSTIITAMLAFRVSLPGLSRSRNWKKMLMETLDEGGQISLAFISQQAPYFLGHKFHSHNNFLQGSALSILLLSFGTK